MNDNDLERRLRAESGPREQGYVPSELPATLDPMPAARPPRAMRMAILGSGVAAGILVVVVAGALLSNNDPGGIGSDPTSTPAPSTGTPPPASCQAEDVELSAEPWGGAAGSRGTVVTARLVDGRYPCELTWSPGAEITDDQGEDVISSEFGGYGTPFVLQPGADPTVTVTWSNWCGPTVEQPIYLTLLSQGVPFAVDVPAGADPVPPCTGDVVPSFLSITRFDVVPER